jgi:hypothetical protein
VEGGRADDHHPQLIHAVESEWNRKNENFRNGDAENHDRLDPGRESSALSLAKIQVGNTSMALWG